MVVDLFLLLLVICVIVGAVVANTRVLTRYQQPEDSKFSQSVFCKAVIVTSMTLAWVMCILLPVDVRNSRPTPGAVDMSMLWSLAFGVLMAFLALVVPATMFYYETEGDVAIKKPKCHVCCNLCFLLIFFSCFTAISYAFLGKAEIPVVEYGCDSWIDASATPAPLELGKFICSTPVDTNLEIQVGFSIYLIAALCFIGWFFFVVFAGIGLSALPLDLILDFVDRPQAINNMEYEQRKRAIAHASLGLIAESESLTEEDSNLSVQTGWRANRKKAALISRYNKFKCNTLLLETQFEKLQISKFCKGESLAASITKLIVGIFSAIVSIMWVLHVLVYMVPRMLSDDGRSPAGYPSTTFLNGLFEAFETGNNAAYPMGVALFAFFTLYLLLAVVKGALKFGMRFFFFMAIHPMRVKGTPLNSILFNVQLILISCGPVVQFTQIAFADYARLTDAEVIFAAQIKYLAFYSFFFKHGIFIWTLLGCFVLALIYLLVKPRESPVVKFDKKTDKKLAKMALPFVNLGKQTPQNKA